MRRMPAIPAKTLAAVLGLGIAAIVTVGVLQLSASGQSDPKQEPVVNPCTGLTDQQCQDLIAGLSKAFNERYSTWIDQFNNAPIDLRSLQRVPALASYTPPSADLASALKAADAIVVGSIAGVKFHAQDGIPRASVTMAVEKSVKGVPGATVTLSQLGGPDASAGWDAATPPLGYAENDPLLLPGARALLFLKYDQAIASYRVQSWTGHYLIDQAGKLSALEGNPFAASVNGKTADQFVAMIAALLAQPPVP